MKTQKKEFSTNELQETFKVIGFGYGYVVVQNKETGEKGSFDFTKSFDKPRVYFNYKSA